MSGHLVTGASGQDGRLLVGLLASAGARVVACGGPGSRPERRPGVVAAALDVTDTDHFAALVREHQPDCVHNLAAISSVRRSWDEPDAVEEVNHLAVVRMLDTLESLRPSCRFVQASTSEIFGPVPGGVADEGTAPAPVSPYARAKADAHRAVDEARGVLGTTNLILFGHTGPGHADSFVLPTVVRQAAEVAAGLRDAVELHDPSVARDWGSARDFVRAFPLAAQADPGDFVIGTGELHALREIATWALAAVGGRAPVVSTGPDRSADFGGVRADARRAEAVLGWRPTIGLRHEVDRMARAALSRLDRTRASERGRDR